ncbi:MAG: endonuclease/exonuclease/phosphatase family protein, partial [Alcaligenes sp.]
MSVIRVVSYNIHKGRSASGKRESLADLRLGLYGLSPDLLFLQEVQGRNQLQGSLDAQHESLAAALRMNTAYGCNVVRPHTDHGNALLSRFPILQYENQDISDHRMEQRGLLHAVVDVSGRPVHCIVVHLGLFNSGRVRQVQALLDRIKRIVPADEPLLIAGDFNDWNNRLAPIFVQQLNLY